MCRRALTSSLLRGGPAGRQGERKIFQVNFPRSNRRCASLIDRPCAPMRARASGLGITPFHPLSSNTWVVVFPLPTADEHSFGSRAAKVEGCVLQRRAWDANVEILTPLFTSLRGPLPEEDRKKGVLGLSWTERLESMRLKSVFDSSKAEEEAKAAMVKAACFGRA